MCTPPRQGACRPLRAIFYAQTDWLRLATRLAAQPSPCAQYYVSVPPLAAAKTTLRNGEAAKIRALGPNFHALAEIHYSGWSQWVASNSATWFDAGVEARKRMEAAGFDVSKGDTWAVNELSSAVRVGTGAARQNARDLVRGLATGSGGTPVKGVAWTVGISQPVDRHDALPDEPPELDGRRRVLDGHGRVRLRLVAGGLPRLAEDGRPRGRPRSSAATT